jgi:hypothetical protein
MTNFENVLNFVTWGIAASPVNCKLLGSTVAAPGRIATDPKYVYRNAGTFSNQAKQKTYV